MLAAGGNLLSVKYDIMYVHNRREFIYHRQMKLMNEENNILASTRTPFVLKITIM